MFRSQKVKRKLNIFPTLYNNKIPKKFWYFTQQGATFLNGTKKKHFTCLRCECSGMKTTIKLSMLIILALYHVFNYNLQMLYNLIPKYTTHLKNHNKLTATKILVQLFKSYVTYHWLDKWKTPSVSSKSTQELCRAQVTDILGTEPTTSVLAIKYSTNQCFMNRIHDSRVLNDKIKENQVSYFTCF